MSGCLDIALDWNLGNALTEVDGDVWVDDLAEGEDRYVYVSHSVVPFALAEYPRIDVSQGVVDGLVIDVVSCAEVSSSMEVTDGVGFVLHVTVPTGVSGADQSRGGADADWHIYWTRRGVLGDA